MILERDFSYLSGFGLMLYLAVTQAVACIFLLFGGTVGVLCSLCSLLATVYLFLYLFRGESLKKRIAVLSTVFLALAAFLLLSGFCFDMSFDGNWYHKASLGSIAHGWNPLYSSLEEFANEPFGVNIGNLAESAIWADHYCKFPWYVGASLYSLTGNIECAKAVNLVAMLSLALLVYSYLSKRLGFFRAFLFSLLCAANPLTLSQCLTFYNDGLLMCVLFSLITVLLMIEDRSDRNLYILLFLILTVLLNIKFTALLYGAVFCFTFYIIRLIRAKKEGHFLKALKGLTGFYAVSVGFSVLFLGLSSYVKNTVQHKNPFYPLIGEGAVDIMTANSPSVILDMPTVKRLIASIFSETSNLIGEGELQGKMPFTVSPYEAKVAQSAPDLRIGGFGPLFGGIILVSLALLLFAAVYLLLKNRRALLLGSAVLIPSAILLLTIKESFWARYSPHLYLFPLTAVLFVMYLSKKGDIYKRLPFYVISIALSVLLIFNSSFFAAYTVKNIIKSRDVYDNLVFLRVISKDSPAEIWFQSYAYYGIEYNFKDYNINYQIVPPSVGTPYDMEIYGTKAYLYCGEIQ